jgi:hypothetical protein
MQTGASQAAAELSEAELVVLKVENWRVWRALPHFGQVTRSPFGRSTSFS